jgi:hypothetical protein
MKNKLLERLKRLEVELKPEVTTIPPEAQEIIDRMMLWKSPETTEQAERITKSAIVVPGKIPPAAQAIIDKIINSKNAGTVQQKN